MLGPDGAPNTGDETDPLADDSDGDGLRDGLESGVTSPVPGGTSDDAGIPYSGTDTGSPSYTPDDALSAFEDPEIWSIIAPCKYR